MRVNQPTKSDYLTNSVSGTMPSQSLRNVIVKSMAGFLFSNNFMSLFSIWISVILTTLGPIISFPYAEGGFWGLFLEKSRVGLAGSIYSRWVSCRGASGGVSNRCTWTKITSCAFYRQKFGPHCEAGAQPNVYASQI